MASKSDRISKISGTISKGSPRTMATGQGVKYIPPASRYLTQPQQHTPLLSAMSITVQTFVCLIYLPPPTSVTKHKNEQANHRHRTQKYPHNQPPQKTGHRNQSQSKRAVQFPSSTPPASPNGGKVTPNPRFGQAKNKAAPARGGGGAARMPNPERAHRSAQTDSAWAAPCLTSPTHSPQSTSSPSSPARVHITAAPIPRRRQRCGVLMLFRPTGAESNAQPGCCGDGELVVTCP